MGENSPNLVTLPASRQPLNQQPLNGNNRIVEKAKKLT
jgi:hypothetical protein